MAMQPKNEQDCFRPSANFPPTLWGCSFALFSLQDSVEFQSYNKEVEILKEEVKHMLIQSTGELIKNIEFINLLCRLGVSYHFEEEIEKQTNHIFTSLPNFLNENDCDLYIVSLLFRVLRQYGHKVPCDVFNKFKGSDGKFNKSIINDVKGILSLYEASFLSVHGEDILDEALVFTKQNLEILATKSSPRLAKHINNALLLPFHHSIERIEARKYISFYEEDEFRNEILLKFAKLDFNRLQLFYRQELGLLSRWWKDINLVGKIPYSRDRIVEAYLWAIGAHFKPHCSVSRMLVAKYIQMVTLVDDTYDAYGKFDELQCFTAAIERLNISAIDTLPEYMKVLYRFILDFFKEIENDGYNTCFLKEKFKEMVRAYFVEAQWLNDGYLPTFDEYMQNGLATSGHSAIPAAAFIGMGNVVGNNVYEWLQSNPKIVRGVKFISRLVNDIVGHEEEQKRGDSPSSVECYMKEFGISQEKAIEEIQKICANAWKDINEDYMKPNVTISRFFLKYYLDLARTLEFIYTRVDSFTHASSLKDDIVLMFVEQLPV